MLSPEQIDLLRESLFPTNLGLELLTFGQAAQPLDQLPTLDQERPPDLVAAEAMHQLNGPPPAQTEQTLHTGPTHHRRLERFQPLEDCGDRQ